jgi:hypothetical protein
MFGAVEYGSLVTGLQTAFESGVTTALPVAGAIIAATLVIKTIKRVVGAH